MPPRPATNGSANRRRSRSSPRSNSRRASSPTTKKKNVISPLFTQSRRSSATPEPPSVIESVVDQSERVRRRVDVDPDERRDRRREQDRRAARLGAQELAQRRLDAPRPRRPAGEARSLWLVDHMIRSRMLSMMDADRARRLLEVERERIERALGRVGTAGRRRAGRRIRPGEPSLRSLPGRVRRRPRGGSPRPARRCRASRAATRRRNVRAFDRERRADSRRAARGPPDRRARRWPKRRPGDPGGDEPLSFETHVKPLFREGDRQSMQFAFDLGPR